MADAPRRRTDPSPAVGVRQLDAPGAEWRQRGPSARAMRVFGVREPAAALDEWENGEG